VPPPDSHYQRLFTGAGTGSYNMVDYFSTMSHGNIDVSGSEIFGWFTLTVDRAAYVGGGTPGPGQYDRGGLIELCRQTASNNGVNLSAFDGTLITFSGYVDLFALLGGMTAFCDIGSLSPSPLGQEMGHGYGLDHARRNGSSLDALDPWDDMSVYDSAFMAPSDEWGTIGPGLNAWCMRSQGWLDESRVWGNSLPSFEDAIVEIRPLHRLDLPGFIAANIGEFLVEYRPAQRWDAAFPRSAVFVHRFEDNHSYVMGPSAAHGNYDLQAGDSFRSGYLSAFSPESRVDVLAIDDNALTATLRLSHRPAATVSRLPFAISALLGQLVGGVAVDGSGGVIIGGVYHPVPPRGPETEILAQLGAYLAAADITDVSLRAQVRLAALKAIGRVAAARSAELGPIRSPSPRRHERDAST
jgi:hypothetical protein